MGGRIEVFVCGGVQPAVQQILHQQHPPFFRNRHLFYLLVRIVRRIGLGRLWENDSPRRCSGRATVWPLLPFGVLRELHEGEPHPMPGLLYHLRCQNGRSAGGDDALPPKPRTALRRVRGHGNDRDLLWDVSGDAKWCTISFDKPRSIPARLQGGSLSAAAA